MDKFKPRPRSRLNAARKQERVRKEPETFVAALAASRTAVASAATCDKDDASVITSELLRAKGFASVDGWWQVPLHHTDILMVEPNVRPAYLRLCPGPQSPFWIAQLTQLRSGIRMKVELSSKLFWRWADVRDVLAVFVSS